MKLFTPGPIAMDPETIAIGGTQSQYFRTPGFSAIMLECMEMLQVVLDAPDNTRIIFLTASGTAAMEAAVMNVFNQNDKLLLIAGGTFGNRFREICAIHHIPLEVIEISHGQTFENRMLDKYENSGITGMLVNMCETSTGQLYPMDVISNFCKRNHICLIVDAISSFLCDPFSMKDMGIGAAIISSQKGLALQPGMSFVAVEEKVFETRCKKNNPPSLYFRFTGYYPEILRGQTEFTPAIGIINQLHDKLKRVINNGTQPYINHCRDLALYFRNQLKAGTEFAYPEYPLSNCVTPVICKKNNAKYIVSKLRDSYDMYVVPAAGVLADSMFRVAHMSPQITKSDIDELVELLNMLDVAV